MSQSTRTLIQKKWAEEARKKRAAEAAKTAK